MTLYLCIKKENLVFNSFKLYVFRQIKGSSKEVGLIYEKNSDDEVEDLYHLLKDIQVV